MEPLGIGLLHETEGNFNRTRNVMTAHNLVRAQPEEALIAIAAATLRILRERRWVL